MKLTLALFALVACSHQEPAATTPPATSPAQPTETVAAADPEPMVDPTLPSWAPRSCSGYHAAVVRALDCDAIGATKRAQIKADYDVEHAKWVAMHDEAPETVNQVGETCQSDLKSLRVIYDAQCTTAAAETH